MLYSIIEDCLQHKRTVLMILTLLICVGTYSYITIPKESSPDIPIPIIYVSIIHDGISPEDAERLLIRPMETELRSIEGVKEMKSFASEGRANVTLEFEAGFDEQKALDDVREKVDLAKSELPDDTEEPTVNEVNFALFPVIVVNIFGNVPERTLIRLGRDLEDKIEGISEVLEVDIGGDREDLVEIIIMPSLMETYNIIPVDVFSLISQNNMLIAAGSMNSSYGRLPVKVPGKYETVEEILNTPLRVVGDKIIKVSDIATVRKSYKDPVGFAYVNGRPALTLEVKKRVGENVIETVENVKRTVNQERLKWPDEIEVSFSQDQSKDIRIMLSDLQNNMISAILLVLIVVIGALGVRSGLLVGVAIPGSFLTGILCLKFMGMTVNVVVLFSLILAVGMLVDGAIVVIEFADRKMNEGIPRFQAYLQASQRMALPIIASTITTLAAFMPLLFWPGTIGEFMKFLPITLIATLTASLFMALIFVPTLGSIFGKPGPANTETMKKLSFSEANDIQNIGGFTGVYVKFLKVVLRYPSMILFSACLIFFIVYSVYVSIGKGVEFFPDIEPDRVALHVRMRGNLSIQEIDKLVKEVEERIIHIEGIKTMYTRSGIRFEGEEIPDDTHGILQIEFTDWSMRRKAKEILTEIREATKDLAGIVIQERKEEEGPSTGKPIHIVITSEYPELLDPTMAKIRNKLDSVEGLIDIDDTRQVPEIEWQIKVDRANASRFGANISMVGSAVQFVTNGLFVTDYRPNDTDDEVDIRVRYPTFNRDLDQVEKLKVNTNVGLVPIKNFVDIRPAPKVASIFRSDGLRKLEITANVKDGVLPDGIVQDLQNWLVDESGITSDIKVEFKGEDEEQNESKAFLGKAFIVALFIMSIILVTQFDSFYKSILILSAVLFSTVGVFLGLLITQQPFGIVMNGIGVISLAGIVVNNNIVLIDTFSFHFKNGLSTMNAVLLTASQRLRPVMLTTVTTILGLLPMVLKVNIDFINRKISYGAPSTQWWSQLATSVAFGLAFATILTLVLTPALLILGNRFYKK